MRKLTEVISLILVVAVCSALMGSCSVERFYPIGEQGAFPPEMTETDDIAQAQIQYMSQWEDAIEKLIAKCAELGYDCDYEKARLSLIRYYNLQMNGEAAAGISEQVRAKIISLNTIYNETVKDLLSYIKGTATPQEVMSYDVSTLTISGESQYAVYENGVAAAVYLLGHGHWMNSDMIAWFPSFQTKAVQVEIGLSWYIVERGTGSHEGLNEDDMFDVSETAFNSYRPFFEAAEKAGITVCFLLSPHYFPTFLYDLYPDLALGSFSGFIKYSVNHPVARRAMEVYLDRLLDDVADCPAVSSLCLSNEPMYYPFSSEYDKAAWPEYLEKMFGTIEYFNSLNKTSYASFEAVPLDPGSGRKAQRYAYYSYSCDIFTGWHEWMAGIIHAKSDIPVTAKVWGGIGLDCYSNGIDLVRFGKFCDIMGCDGYAEMGGSYFDNASTNQLWYKFMWYDVLRTLSGKPVYNMEDHIMSCTGWFGSEAEIDALARHVYSDMLGGALHGRSGSMTWTWAYSYNPSDDLYGSALARPLVMDGISKAALDTARLSGVLEAFVKDSPDVYVLYSPTTLKYITDSAVYSAAYRIAGLNTGLNIAYIAEDDLGTLDNDAVLIVPGCNYITDDVFDALRQRAAAGKLILLGKCLKYTEMAVARDAAVLNALYADSYVFTSYETSTDRFAVDNIMRDYLTELCSVEVSVRDNGQPVGDVMHFRYTEYNGRIYVYIVMIGTTYGDCGSYDGLQIYYNGQPVSTLRNELDGTSCGMFSLEQYESALFSFECD